MLISVNEKKHYLDVPLPLTTPTGKVRVKRRNIFYEYSLPHSTKRDKFTTKNYIEWQIGYDLPANSGNVQQKTTLPQIGFVSNKKVPKVFYELSEYVYYFVRWNMITATDIVREISILNRYQSHQLLDKNEKCQINRSHPVEEDINRIRFLSMAIRYPQLVYRIDKYEIIAEVTIKGEATGSWCSTNAIFLYPDTRSAIGARIDAPYWTMC